MDIPVKTGRLCTGAYLRYSPIAQPGNGVFQASDPTQKTVFPPGPGGVSTIPTMTAYASPLDDHFDIATQKKIPAQVSLNNLFVFDPSRKPAVQPQLRSALPMRKVHPVVHMSNGGSPAMPSDSAFHPINQPAPIPKIKSERAGEKINVASFSSHNNLWYGSNQSFYKDQAQVGSGRVGQPRWSIVKQGAVK